MHSDQIIVGLWMATSFFAGRPNYMLRNFAPQVLVLILFYPSLVLSFKVSKSMPCNCRAAGEPLIHITIPGNWNNTENKRLHDLDQSVRGEPAGGYLLAGGQHLAWLNRNRFEFQKSWRGGFLRIGFPFDGREAKHLLNYFIQTHTMFYYLS